MKSYTDIKQSKKLAEILPIESADMYYIKHSLENYYCPIPLIGKYSAIHDQIPCWSLAALLSVLPNALGRYSKILGWFDDSWHCEYMDEDGEGSEYSFSADNQVDACFGMILKLHEIRIKKVKEIQETNTVHGNRKKINNYPQRYMRDSWYND